VCFVIERVCSADKIYRGSRKSLKKLSRILPFMPQRQQVHATRRPHTGPTPKHPYHITLSQAHPASLGPLSQMSEAEYVLTLPTALRVATRKCGLRTVRKEPHHRLEAFLRCAPLRTVDTPHHCAALRC
jgi:hypothetical protein